MMDSPTLILESCLLCIARILGKASAAQAQQTGHLKCEHMQELQGESQEQQLNYTRWLQAKQRPWQGLRESKLLFDEDAP